LVGDAEFMALLEHVVGGTDLEEFADPTLTGDQFTLF
jgi:DNA polymerase-3 subunit epsilon